jgi:hypothetical protein
MAVLTVGVLVLSFKYGTENVTKFDAICVVLALGAIVPWYFTKDPTLSVVLATIIDVLAFFPTIRKTFQEPYTESLSSWAINVFRHGLAIVALSTYVIATVIYPAALLVMNIVMVAVIVSRRSAVQKR